MMATWEISTKPHHGFTHGTSVWLPYPARNVVLEEISKHNGGMDHPTSHFFVVFHSQDFGAKPDILRLFIEQDDRAGHG